MKLITETVEEVRYIVEAKESGKKDFYIEGIFMQGNIKNRNGRTYPTSILEKEVSRYVKETVLQNRAYGELGHPSGPAINLDRVSHMIKELRQDGNNFIGKAKIMDTPFGMIVQNFMTEGASLGVSTRGMGSLKENSVGIMEVQDDFMLATAGDIVADPSAPDAFVRGIMEGKEWVWENGLLKEQHISEMKKTIQKVSKKQLEEAKLLVFKSFFDQISKK